MTSPSPKAAEMNRVKWAEEIHKLCEHFGYGSGVYAAIQAVPKNQKLPPIRLSPDYLKQAGREANGANRRGRSLGKLRSEDQIIDALRRHSSHAKETVNEFTAVAARFPIYVETVHERSTQHYFLN